MSGPSRVVPVVALLVCAVTAGLLVPRDARAQAAPPEPITVGPIVISGFVQADSLVSIGEDADATDTVDTFGIPRARLGVSGELTPKISWYLQGDFANVTNDGRVLRDAYVQITPTSQFAVRMGQMVAPFSLERLTGYQKLELIDRSIVGIALAPSRDMGLMVFNAKPWRGWLTYAAALINGSGQNTADTNSAKDVVARVTSRVPHVDHLTVGFNVQTGEQPQGDRRRIGVDLNYEAPSYRVAVERVAQRRDYDPRVDTTGFTVIGAYKHKAAERRPHYAGYELAARYVDVDDDAFTLESHNVQAGGTYFVTPQLRVMSNLLVPIGDDQPRHTVRWWSRLQVFF